jgi:hypothetical protein
MRMLCIAAVHVPTGYVAVNGRGLGVTDIARLAGVTETEARDLIGELDRNGVFSRDRKGTIYSRRLVRDARKAEIARKNGKNGGNPSLGKNRGNQPSDNPPLKGEVKGGDKPQKPEARSQILEKEPDGSSSVRAATPKRRAVRCPEQWVPKPLPESISHALALMPPGFEERELSRMRDWSKASPNGAKLDWDATWRNWIGRAIDNERRQGNRGSGQSRGGAGGFARLVAASMGS